MLLTNSPIALYHLESYRSAVNLYMKNKYQLVLLFSIGLSTFLFSFFLAVTQTHAQSSPMPSTPFYPLAPCPSCDSPSIPPVLTGTASLTETPQNINPDVNVNISPGQEDPCDEETASIAHDKRKKKGGWHGNQKGALSENMDQLLRFLLELINKILELLGGQPIQIPEPDDEDAPDGDEPNPCPDENQQDNNDDEDNENEEETPDASIAPSPSTTTPGISATPITPSAGTPQPSSIAPSGTTIAGCTQADIQKLVDSVSQASIESLLKTLVQDDSKPTPNELVSRHVSAPGNKQKVDWAKQQFTSWGLTVVPMPFDADGVTGMDNAVGRLQGTDANTLYATGGHIDSTSESPETQAPGADDDGSGTVVAMEAARVLKGFQQCMKVSVDFIGFNDEEESMDGSATYVKQMQGKNFKGLLNMDMIGTGKSKACVNNYYNSTADKPLSDKLAEVNTKYNIGLEFPQSQFSGDGVDSENFWSAGLPSFHADECEGSPVYHKSTDQTNHINFEQLTKMAKIIVAGLAELSSQ